MLSVFGGSGFIGSNFARYSKLPHEIMYRDAFGTENPESLWLISTTHNYHVFDNATLDAETNIIRLLNTLAYLKPGHTVNFVSSWFVYGKCLLPATEETPCDPRGFYSITKRAAEQLLISFCLARGLNYRILRLSNIYGPGDKPSAKKNALTYLIDEMREHRPVSLYWGGNFLRDYLHVKDCIRALDLCIKWGPLNTIINIGSGRSYEFGTLIKTAHGLLKSRSEILSSEPSEFHTQVQARDFSMSTRKLTGLGFTPEVSIADGLAELCK